MEYDVDTMTDYAWEALAQHVAPSGTRAFDAAQAAVAEQHRAGMVQILTAYGVPPDREVLAASGHAWDGRARVWARHDAWLPTLVEINVSDGDILCYPDIGPAPETELRQAMWDALWRAREFLDAEALEDWRTRLLLGIPLRLAH